MKPQLDEKKDGNIFISFDAKLDTDAEFDVESAHLKGDAKFIVVQPFVNDARALIATTVTSAKNGVIKFRAHRFDGAKGDVRFDILVR
jgi:hypothetical protein